MPKPEWFGPWSGTHGPLPSDFGLSSSFVLRALAFMLMLLRARQFDFIFPRPALVMGIVNVTPDSFSDGGQFLEAKAAATHALGLVQQGRSEEHTSELQ